MRDIPETQENHKENTGPKRWMVVTIVIVCLLLVAAPIVIPVIRINVEMHNLRQDLKDQLDAVTPFMDEIQKYQNGGSAENTEDGIEIEITGQVYPEGAYKVGSEIPAGEYAIISTLSSSFFGKATLWADGRGDEVLEDLLVRKINYLTVQEGQYLILDDCKIVDARKCKVIVDEPISPGVYRVGVDIPAGEYKFILDGGNAGTVEIYESSTPEKKHIRFDVIHSYSYVTVQEGQYLETFNCVATLVS